MNIRAIRSLLVMTMLLVVSGCGGGGSGPSTTVIRGTVSKGAVGEALVTVFAVTNGVKGAQLGQPVLTAATGAAKGSYAIDVGTYTGPVLVEATGGQYIDEATGAPRDLVAVTLRAAVANAAVGVTNVAVTPVTEAAVRRMNGDYRAAVITEANTAAGLLFGVKDIVGTLPVDSNSATAASAAPEVKGYALALATVSQYMENTAKGLSFAIADIADLLNPATSAATADPLLAGLVKARTDATADPAVNNTGLGTPVVSTTTATVKISTRGTLPLGTKIGAISLNVILPADVTVNADGATRQIDPANLALSGVAVGSQLVAGSYTPASGTANPGKATVGLAGTAGFGTGEFITLICNVPAGSRAMPSAFLLSKLLVTDVLGNVIEGITAEMTVTIP